MPEENNPGANANEALIAYAEARGFLYERSLRSSDRPLVSESSLRNS
jgi:hypothetical protein